MVKRSAPAETARGIVNTRMKVELRRKLEDAAGKNNRTLAAEIEGRLEASFDDALSSAFRIEAADYVRRTPAAANFLGAVAETFKSIDATSKKSGFTELNTRVSLRAALDRLKYYYLWIGENSSPYPDGYKRKSRTRASEMPPGPLGHSMATSIAEGNIALSDEAAPEDTSEGRISNHWSGDGSRVELQREWSDEEAKSIDEEIRSGRPLEEIMAERGLIFEDPSKLDDYYDTGE